MIERFKIASGYVPLHFTQSSRLVQATFQGCSVNCITSDSLTHPTAFCLYHRGTANGSRELETANVKGLVHPRLAGAVHSSISSVVGTS